MLRLRIKLLEFWRFDRKKQIWVRDRVGLTHAVLPNGKSLCGRPRHLCDEARKLMGGRWASPPAPGDLECFHCQHLLRIVPTLDFKSRHLARNWGLKKFYDNEQVEG
jgi:hypothetical protein